MAGQQSRGDELYSLHGVYIYLHIEIGVLSALLYTCIIGTYIYVCICHIDNNENRL